MSIFANTEVIMLSSRKRSYAFGDFVWPKAESDIMEIDIIVADSRVTGSHCDRI